MKEVSNVLQMKVKVTRQVKMKVKMQVKMHVKMKLKMRAKMHVQRFGHGSCSLGCVLDKSRNVWWLGVRHWCVDAG